MKKEQVDEMSLSEAVNYALGKLVEQGNTCRNEEHVCIYGDGAGNHCAVGWLLDEENSELMNFEGGVSRLHHAHKQELPDLINNNIDVFVKLQELHDNRASIFSEYVDDIMSDINVDEELMNKWVAIKQAENSTESDIL